MGREVGGEEEVEVREEKGREENGGDDEVEHYFVEIRYFEYIDTEVKVLV